MKYYPRPESGLDIHEINLAVEAAFREHGMGNVQMPPKVYITFPEGDFRTMPAYLPAEHLAGLKCVNVHPTNPQKGLPSVMALTIILDVGTGLPLAILNATGLTDLRTGAAGAIATRYLTGKKSVTVGLVGTGRQAAAQLEAISRETDVTGVRVWSRKEESAYKFAEKFSRFNCRAGTLPFVCDCDVLVTTTPSRSPIVMNDWVHEGTHINAIGADAPGKEELDPSILERAMVIVDDPVQAVHSGEINVPIRDGKFSPEEISGTLGEVVLGRKKRTSSGQITIFDSTGLAIQDLAIASIAMKKGKFVELEFL
ncbi:MAG: ornithine cyclodeaminase family protein [Methanoregulaceae archaeon]|jgi:alanine dehydrogenase|nr:ornithine cyclodeaminase family protein [Methanoregulaceae archaeon]